VVAIGDGTSCATLISTRQSARNFGALTNNYKENPMKTQQAWLFLRVPILLLAATLPVLSTYKTSTSTPASIPAPEKVETPYGTVWDAILTYSPSTRMRLQQASTGFQAAQAGRQKVAHFKLQNVAGGFMSSEDLKGKVSVVDLWATWCSPCAEEVPIYNQLYNAFEGQDVAVVGIAVQSPRRDIPSKVRQLGIKYPVLIGDDEALHAFGRIQGYPTTIVMDKEGKIYKQYTGSVPHKEETIKQDVQRLLAEDSR
jgi:thiol-disulfide isomerase/thioredoxin